MGVTLNVSQYVLGLVLSIANTLPNFLSFCSPPVQHKASITVEVDPHSDFDCIFA